MKKMLIDAIDLAKEKTLLNLDYFGEDFPSATTYDYKYKIVENADWTEGFWTGILWMLYEFSDNDKFKEVALKNLDSFRKRFDENAVLDHHDLGFLYTLSSVSAYKLTGNEDAKELAIEAAYKLLNRWHDNPGFIQAWGTMDNEEEHRFIIDSLLNLPLLKWAYEETNDEKFNDVVKRHYEICVTNLIRDDGGSFHTYYVDPISHLPSHGLTAQGYSDDSSWARGQAWSVYGIALNYAHDPSQDKMEKFLKVTNYFIDNLPCDYVSYWDLIFNDGSGHERDSGATAIVVCGILEMLPHIEDKNIIEKYENIINHMMENLITKYSNKDIVEGAPLLNEGVYSWHEDNGVNEGNLWGDYFYLEALMRLADKNWEPYW